MARTRVHEADELVFSFDQAVELVRELMEDAENHNYSIKVVQTGDGWLITWKWVRA